MKKQKSNTEKKSKTTKVEFQKISENTHLGSSQAFEETENPLSRDDDNISDEKLDDQLGNE